MRRGPATLLVVLVLPLFAGCYEESLHVALRVPAGETLVLTGPRTVEGTLLVEQGGTLHLRDADLVIEQALVIQGGTLRAESSRVSFAGPYARHDVELAGTATLRDSTFSGVRWFEVHEGTLLVQGGGIAAGGLRVDDATALSTGVAWTLGPAPLDPDDFSPTPDGTLVRSTGGTLAIENGTLRLAAGARALRLETGEIRLSNLSLDLTRFAETAISVRGGLLHLENVDVTAPPLGRYLAVEDGTVRLVDTPLPRGARYPEVSLSGRLEVAWSLVARVVTFPGSTPVPGANVTLTSAHAPGGVSASAVTDESGEARLVALQYVYGGGQTRAGNPHVVRASAEGRSGASPAVVMEAPAVVIVPLASSPAAPARQEPQSAGPATPPLPPVSV